METFGPSLKPPPSDQNVRQPNGAVVVPRTAVWPVKTRSVTPWMESVSSVLVERPGHSAPKVLLSQCELNTSLQVQTVKFETGVLQIFKPV